MPTLFSRIIARELPSHGVRENDDFYAFLDINPVAPGHTLVVPKVEEDEFFALEPHLLERILIFAQPIAHALKTVTGASRVAMAVAGFDVPHAHLHLIPANDMRALDFSRARPASPKALAEMAAAIKKALDG